MPNPKPTPYTTCPKSQKYKMDLLNCSATQEEEARSMCGQASPQQAPPPVLNSPVTRVPVKESASEELLSAPTPVLGSLATQKELEKGSPEQDGQDFPRSTQEWEDYYKNRVLAGLDGPALRSLSTPAPSKPTSSPAAPPHPSAPAFQKLQVPAPPKTLLADNGLMAIQPLVRPGKGIGTDQTNRGKGKGPGNPIAAAPIPAPVQLPAPSLTQIPSPAQQPLPAFSLRQIPAAAQPPPSLTQIPAPAQLPLPVPSAPTPSVPSDDDPAPPPEPSAIWKRLDRIFKPRADGTYLVPQSLLEDWKDKSRRPGIVRLFEKVAWDRVAGLKLGINPTA